MRKILKIIGIVLVSIVGLIMISFFLLGIYFSDDFPVERTLTDYTSPDGAHVCSVRTTTGDFLSPMRVVANVRGSGILGNRTIYVVKHIDEASVIWVDDRTVWINGVKLDIYQDKYVSEVDSLYGP